MKSIGGYFDLELTSKSQAYHVNAIALNTARNAFEYVLTTKKTKKVYLPYFTCEVMLEPVRKLNIPIYFYSIDENLEPVFDFNVIEEEDAFLYTNYFGLKNKYVEYLSSTLKQLIVDNAQAFFTKPFNNEPAIYSARKFFGVSDGAYLYTNVKSASVFDRDLSYSRMSHLLIRKDVSAEDGYKDFVENDRSLENNEVKHMSNLTSAILESLDYDHIAKKRIDNYTFLDSALNESNLFKFELKNTYVPMLYPYWTKDMDLKKRLLSNRIYCPTYWPNVKQWCEPGSLEYKFTDEVVYLPTDQRYGEKEMKVILDIIFGNYEYTR